MSEERKRHRGALKVKLVIAAILAVLAIVLAIKIGKTAPDQSISDKPSVEEVHQYQFNIYLPNDTYVETGNEEEGRVLPYEIQIASKRPVEETALIELFKGGEEERFKALYEGLIYNKIEVKEKIAYVDFKADSIRPQGSLSETLILESMVRTLTDLEDIDSVQILMDGEVTETFAGHVAIDQPLDANYLNGVA